MVLSSVLSRALHISQSPDVTFRIRLPAASHQCGPGSIPGLGVICGLSLLLVLVPAPSVFLRYSGFPPSAKTNISKFQFDLETVERRATPWIPLKFHYYYYYYYYFVITTLLYTEALYLTSTLPFGTFCKRAISSRENGYEEDSTLLSESVLNFITFRILTSSSNLDIISGAILAEVLLFSDKEESLSAS